MHLTLPFQKAKHRNFSSRTTTPLALPMAAKIALVDLNLATHQLRRLSLQSGKDDLSQLVVKQDRRVPIYPHNLRRRPCRNARAEILGQFFLNATRQTAPSTFPNHLI